MKKFRVRFLFTIALLNLLLNNSLNGQEDAEKETNVIQKIWENKSLSSQVGFVALSPDATKIAVLDNAQHRVMVIQLETGKIVFEKPASNSELCFSKDSQKLCVAEFAGPNSMASLYETSSGELIGQISIQDVKGRLRRAVDQTNSMEFFVRLSNAKIAKLNFDDATAKTILSVGDTKDFEIKVGPRDLIKDYDIRNGQVFGTIGNQAFAYDAVKKSLMWKANASSKFTAFLNGNQELVLDSKSTRTPHQILSPNDGSVLRSINVTHPTTRLIRNNFESRMILINDVRNSNVQNQTSTLDVIEPNGNTSSSTKLSKIRTVRVSHAIVLDQHLYFARAGANGEVQVWRMASE